MINTKLAKDRGLSENQIKMIEFRHDMRQLILTEMECCDTVDVFYKEMLVWYRANEAALQNLWGFPKDRGMTREYELPLCTCPKLDNYDDGGKHVWFNESCPVHGGS